MLDSWTRIELILRFDATSKRFWPHGVRLRLLGRGYGTNWRAFLPSKPSIDVNSNGNLHTFGYTLQSSHGFWIIRWFSRWLTVLPIFIYSRFLILSFDDFFVRNDWLGILRSLDGFNSLLRRIFISKSIYDTSMIWQTCK